ncbi:MAG: aminomethyl-transferring glycine dehydrogenase subunit GcvPA [Leptospiraceae bacterium]|nr:aminomethyl-transferring glycine dehydrogenase subunit GcvPA [Leptospiraceae bacterium]MDW7974955.1 aminomethyl-transferring glycine dehydrogenase subunit GcvPA [Leptospiraceae bacterium]
MKYLPISETQVNDILQKLNKTSIEDFFSHIPKEYTKSTSSFLDEPKSESEIRRYITETIQKHNLVIYPHQNFMGGNGHAHEIPAIIDTLTSRGEFLTAYTPYQPEVSQGSLQAMFEYQTMMAELMGVDVSNASLYDGSTSVIEAILMACRIKKKYKVLVSSLFHKEYLETIETYSQLGPFEYELIPQNEEGKINVNDLKSKLEKQKQEISAVVIQSPNSYGIIEDLELIQNIVYNHDVLLIVAVLEAISLGLLQPPGKYADIVCGEAQSFGIPLNFGGPWLGFIGTRNEFLRNLPGRLIGMGTDVNGKRAFAVTLSTREQHIKREKATSNICTNQALMALRATIYLSLVGKRGLQEIALRCAKLTQYAKQLLTYQQEIKLVYPKSPVFNEIYIKTPIPAGKVFERVLESQNIAAGTIVDENHLLVSFNETMKPSDIEKWKNTLIAACK